MPDLENVKKTLETLRDIPADTDSAGEDVLGLISDFLLDISSGDAPVHWFCNRADKLTVDSATFLLRLHGYSSERIQKWRVQLARCLRGCSACIRGLSEAKISSKHTFFGAFSEEILKAFWADFSQWELKIVREGLMDAKMTSNLPPTRTLNDAPPAIVYHIFANIDILLTADILHIVHSCIPSTTTVTLSLDPLPPGILLLAFDEDSISRAWARSHLKAAEIFTGELLVGPYIEALDKIINAISANHSTEILPFFSADLSILWSGVCLVLRLLPSEYFATAKARQLEIHRIVLGHLHDNGPHFIDVLRSLVIICKRIGSDLWTEEGTSTDYPQVIFDAIKDNPAYIDLLLKQDPSPWLLAWYMDYLHTIWNLPVLSGVVAKMADFLCEELQHERFQELRPSVMVAASRLLGSIDRKARDGGTPHQRGMSGNAVDIHCGIFISIAFDRVYNVEKWSEARKAAREVVKNVLTNDTIDVLDAVIRLSKRLINQKEDVLVPSLRRQMWKEVYSTLQGNDADGIAMIISVVASFAHVDRLTTKAFRDLFKKEEGHVSENVFTAVNGALDVFHAGFMDAVSKYANYNSSSAILDLLQRTGMVKDVMALMLSPVNEIQVAAQTLVGQAFDVDVRQECFRALIENLPGASLAGIFNFLDTFINYASLVPEACGLSKSIVRCMTDIIDVLCSSEDGLLRSQTFTKKKDDGPGPAGELPRWWKLMTQTISVIFKRTPTWSLYFGNEEMVVWMRDALIFGRDMLAQRRVIESAAVASSAESTTLKPGKLSRIGRRMVEDLRDVLPELGRWLRLTDEELLHQSFALLETLLACFKETQIPPPEAGIAKLTKHIDDARKKDPKRPQTRLDSTRLAKLEAALATFLVDGDDEVQIISQPILPKEPKEKEKSDSDVEIVAGPSKTERQTISQHLPRNEGKMRFKPSKPADSSSNQSISKFLVADDKKRLNGIAPKASSLMERARPGSKISLSKPLLGKADGKKAIAIQSSSSSESSESEESAGEGELAFLAKLQRTPKKKQPAERRQVKMMDLPTARNAALERMNRREDIKRTQLRLKPDISRFHRTLLSWNYDHPGSDPPLHGSKPLYLQVPDKFSSHEQYLRVFEPLLMMECWAQIVKAKDESGDTYQCTISARQFVDTWLDLDIYISDQVKKDWKLMETDVVLLRHLDGKKCVMGKVQSYKATHLGITGTIRCVVETQVDPGLQTTSSWRISKVMSLSTIHREYATLMAVPYYDLFDVILQPKLTRKPYLDPRDVGQAMEKYGVNEPQASAILGSMKVDGFSLIQGPPGTGKTSTICGLVQAYLSKRPRATVTITAGRNATADKTVSPKILLCAPSNAAIDEVAHRLKDGTLGSGKQGVCPKVVRIGADSSVNISVREISLDYLVDQKLDSSPDINPKEASNEIALLRKELDSVKKQRQEKHEELSQVQNNTARSLTLQDEIKRLNSRRMALTQQFDRLKDKQKSDFRTLDATRRRFRLEVLQEADVICGTLSGSGQDALQLEQFDYEMVIIDEAAQAIELSSLIPLKYKCRRCVMVGDPQQLPPTVLSLEACKYQYNQSLFVRFQKDNPAAVHLLSIQYRMHPEISRLPSRVFYDGRLLDGPDMAIKTKQPWHIHEKFGPYKFFNVSGQEQVGNSHSLINKLECNVTVALFARLRQEFSSVDFDFRIGVISMYRAQIGELRRTFTQRFGQDIIGRVDFNTVDGFQGQEKDIIILSCVRAGPGVQSVGFLADTRRMNVALTRARSSLFILGHAPTLERSDQFWRQIVQDARARKAMADADVSYFTSRAHQPIVRNLPKAAKPSTPTPIIHIPDDLVIPREMKPPSKRVPSNQSTNHAVDSVNLETPGTMASRSSQKRPAPSEDLSRPPPAQYPPQHTVGEGSGSKPKLRPPPKREKGGPSLFIPKKRPAPQGNLGAPPAKRRP